MNIDDYINEHFDEITEGVESSLVTKFLEQLKRAYTELEKENTSQESSIEEDEEYETDFVTVEEVNQALTLNIEAINDALVANYSRCQEQIETLTTITKLQERLIQGLQKQVDLLADKVLNSPKNTNSKQN